MLKFVNKLDVVISDINFISKLSDKYKFVLKFIQLVAIPNLIPLEVVQKCSVAISFEIESSMRSLFTESFSYIYFLTKIYISLIHF